MNKNDIEKNISKPKREEYKNWRKNKDEKMKGLSREENICLLVEILASMKRVVN